MILFITTSAEITIDVLVENILDVSIFRLNFDLWRDYKMTCSESEWSITDPTGRMITSDTVSCCMWWKAFNALLPGEEPYVINELKYIFREIYNYCERRGLTYGSRFDYHNTTGKLVILNIARRYFPTPRTMLGWNMGSISLDNPVTKSLSSYQFENKKAMYAQRVDPDRLNPAYPWTFQELVESDYDVTIFQNGDSFFAFQRSRADLSGIDWRERLLEPNCWNKFDLDDSELSRLRALSADLSVSFGRYDFMRQQDGSLVFLELNATGQWMFLDHENKLGVVNSVVTSIRNVSRAREATIQTSAQIGAAHEAE